MSETEWVNAGVRRWVYKIAGGNQTTLTEFPFQAYLAQAENNELICGATILTTLVVLTAAHCISGRNASSVKLIAGDSNRKDLEGTEQVIQATQLIPHHLWQKDHVEHDIGLVILSSPLTFNNKVSNISFPINPKSYAGIGSISGWGKTHEGNIGFENSLRYARIPIVPIAECAKKWESSEESDDLILSDNFICAYKDGTDACTGDSGGPLTGKRGKLRQVIGVVAVGPGCAGGAVLPGVYINVSRYGSWILLKILEAGKNPGRCANNFFYCPTSGTCINPSLVCDGINDCGSTAEDEKNCEICQLGKFRCPLSNTCISNSKWCDGSRDCPSGEDERDCGACPHKGYRCNRDKKCLPPWSKCNWHEDCDGGDDEANCPPVPTFTCKSGRKIPRNWTCDGISDCPSGEDEACSHKCNKACRPYQQNDFNEAVIKCCKAANYKTGYCNPGDLAFCQARS